jgi:cell division protease FtsH
VFLGDELMRSKNYSEATSEAIDHEVRGLLESCYARATEILNSRAHETAQVAKALLRYETITGDEVREILAGASADDVRRPPVQGPRIPAGDGVASVLKARIARADAEPDEGLAGEGMPAPGPA